MLGIPTVPFAHFRPNAHVMARDGTHLTFAEKVLLSLIVGSGPKIVERARRRLAKEWDTFAQDQGVDPFASHARVEIGLDRNLTLAGRWTMVIYWSSSDEAWAGMHLQFDCFLTWPLNCHTVF